MCDPLFLYGIRMVSQNSYKQIYTNVIDVLQRLLLSE